MFTNPLRAKARTGLAVIGAAALLVGGVDLASYATTGDSLVLGHSNKADKTTKLTNTGKKGPALALKAKKGPALAVNSTDLVSKLNADLLDGKDSSTLETTTTRYGIGTVSTTAVPDGQYFAQITLPAGAYEMGIHGEFNSVGSSGSGAASCLVIDPTIFSNPSNLDYSKLFLGGAVSTTGNNSGIMDDRNVVTLSAPATVDYGCVMSGSQYAFAQPMFFTVHPLSAFANGAGTPTTLPVPRGALTKLVH
jgi:hypothetical protein